MDAFRNAQTGFPSLSLGFVQGLFNSTTNCSSKATTSVNGSLHVSDLPGLVCLGTKKLSCPDTPLTGKDMQDCVNQFLLDQGEDLLEKAVCAYVTAGAGAAFCESLAFKAGQYVFNKVLNYVIEKPIVEVMDSVEDAALSAAHACENVISEVWHLI